jgi:hypothetical protein
MSVADRVLSPRLARRRAAAAHERVATTPRRLRMLSIAIASLAVALTVLGAGTLIVAELTVTNIQQHTVPSILSMQRIHALLSDADRSAANAYLAGGSEVTLPELQYLADIGAASRELQSASEQNPGGPDTSQRLQAIVTGVDQYVELIQTANVDDRLNQQAIGTVYLTAGTTLMQRPDGGILAQVDGLRNVYGSDLDRSHRLLQIIRWMLAIYGIVAIALLGLLLYTQRFLRQRFRRRRNPRLLVGTLLLAIVSAASVVGAMQASSAIDTAQEVTYPRLLNLWGARALLADANGAESRALIAHDGNARTTADQSFAAWTRSLVDRPLTDQMIDDGARGHVNFRGILADELRASTTSQERDAAVRVLRFYQRFMNVDAAVRAKAAAGAQTEAITLALGTDQGQVTFAFDDVDWYLGLSIQHQQSQFDSSITLAERIIAVTAVVELLALAIAALAYWGLEPRIDEFRAGGARPT